MMRLPTGSTVTTCSGQTTVVESYWSTSAGPAKEWPARSRSRCYTGTSARSLPKEEKKALRVPTCASSTGPDASSRRASSTRGTTPIASTR